MVVSGCSHSVTLMGEAASRYREQPLFQTGAWAWPQKTSPGPEARAAFSRTCKEMPSPLVTAPMAHLPFGVKRRQFLSLPLSLRGEYESTTFSFAKLNKEHDKRKPDFTYLFLV